MFISKSMTRNVVTIGQDADISQAQEKMYKHHFRHLPVVDETNLLIGIVTDRDIRSAMPSSHLFEFINVMGLEKPGALLCIIVENKIGQMKKVVDAITEENISFGSVMVARYWEKGKRAIFPYLLTQNIGPLKRKLKKMGYTLLDPMDWYMNHLPKDD